MIDIESCNEALAMLAEAPDSQIDKSITDRLSKLKLDSNNIDSIKNELMLILDECCYASLASDFAMKALYQTFFQIGTQEDLDNYKSIFDK